MPPLNKGPTAHNDSTSSILVDAKTEGGQTVIVKDGDLPPFAKCTSSEPFVNPFSKPQTAAEVIQTLNLNLGQRWVTPDTPFLMPYLHLIAETFGWLEHIIFTLIYMLPESVPRFIFYSIWKVYFPLHKRWLGRSTGIHKNVSLECHALATFMYIAQFVPAKIPRVRVALRQFTAARPKPVVSTIERVHETILVGVKNLPERQRCRVVKGLYLHHNNETPTEYTIMWVYGGAFLSGCPEGNAGPADVIARQCGVDVFIPNYRLAPEHTFEDIQWDVCLAYRYLYERRKARGQDPSKLLLIGWSAGGSLCTRLMQCLQHGSPSFLGSVLDGLSGPRAAVLICPFVLYDHRHPDSSMMQYCKHDWIVTPLIIESGLKHLDLDEFWGGDNLKHSPLAHSFQGLPPLCIILSEHETCYDEGIELVQATRAAGVPTTVGLWRYMPHAWFLFSGMLPEGAQSLNFVSEWIIEQTS